MTALYCLGLLAVSALLFTRGYPPLEYFIRYPDLRRTMPGRWRKARATATVWCTLAVLPILAFWIVWEWCR